MLLVFEICTLLGLGGLDRATWAGAWGFAGALALRSALGQVGSWVVAGTLFAVTLLAASELGFHWIARLARRAVVDPAVGLGTAWGAWRESHAPAGRGEAADGAEGEGAPPGGATGPRGRGARGAGAPAHLAAAGAARPAPPAAPGGPAAGAEAEGEGGEAEAARRRRTSRRARCRPRRSRR